MKDAFFSLIGNKVFVILWQMWLWVESCYGSSSKIFLLLVSGWVGSASSGSGKFPSKISNFSIFLHLDLKIYLGQSQVNPLSTAGQKYAWVGSGPISTRNSPTRCWNLLDTENLFWFVSFISKVVFWVML